MFKLAGRARWPSGVLLIRSTDIVAGRPTAATNEVVFAFRVVSGTCGFFLLKNLIVAVLFQNYVSLMAQTTSCLTIYFK